MARPHPHGTCAHPRRMKMAARSVDMANQPYCSSRQGRRQPEGAPRVSRSRHHRASPLHAPPPAIPGHRIDEGMQDHRRVPGGPASAWGSALPSSPARVAGFQASHRTVLIQTPSVAPGTARLAACRGSAPCRCAAARAEGHRGAGSGARGEGKRTGMGGGAY